MSEEIGWIEWKDMVCVMAWFDKVGWIRTMDFGAKPYPTDDLRQIGKPLKIEDKK